jgi:hypothetical protein
MLLLLARSLLWSFVVRHLVVCFFHRTYFLCSRSSRQLRSMWVRSLSFPRCLWWRTGRWGMTAGVRGRRLSPASGRLLVRRRRHPRWSQRISTACASTASAIRTSPRDAPTPPSAFGATGSVTARRTTRSRWFFGGGCPAMCPSLLAHRGGWFAAATSAASGRPAAAPASASLGPAAAGFPPPPPPPRRDPSPPPPPPHRASPPPPPSPRRASPLSTHPTRWASPPPLQPRDPAARPPPRRDGVRRGATGSHPRLGRGRLAACALQDPPPRLGREGWPVAAVCGTQPPAAASGAEAGRGPIGHLSFDAASPLPVDHPFRRPRSETCIIPRTVEIAANEIALERALVVMVAGTRPVNAFRCPGLHHGSLRLAVWVIYNACAPSGGLPYAFSGL